MASATTSWQSNPIYIGYENFKRLHADYLDDEQLSLGNIEPAAPLLAEFIREFTDEELLSFLEQIPSDDTRSYYENLFDLGAVFVGRISLLKAYASARSQKGSGKYPGWDSRDTEYHVRALLDFHHEVEAIEFLCAFPLGEVDEYLMVKSTATRSFQLLRYILPLFRQKECHDFVLELVKTGDLNFIQEFLPLLEEHIRGLNPRNEDTVFTCATYWNQLWVVAAHKSWELFLYIEKRFPLSSLEAPTLGEIQAAAIERNDIDLLARFPLNERSSLHIPLKAAFRYNLTWVDKIMVLARKHQWTALFIATYLEESNFTPLHMWNENYGLLEKEQRTKLFELACRKNPDAALTLWEKHKTTLGLDELSRAEALIQPIQQAKGLIAPCPQVNLTPQLLEKKVYQALAILNLLGTPYFRRVEDTLYCSRFGGEIWSPKEQQRVLQEHFKLRRKLEVTYTCFSCDHADQLSIGVIGSLCQACPSLAVALGVMLKIKSTFGGFKLSFQCKPDCGSISNQHFHFLLSLELEAKGMRDYKAYPVEVSLPGFDLKVQENMPYLVHLSWCAPDDLVETLPTCSLYYYHMDSKIKLTFG